VVVVGRWIGGGGDGEEDERYSLIRVGAGLLPRAITRLPRLAHSPCVRKCKTCVNLSLSESD